MLYRLIFLCGPRTGERITVTEEPMTIGRATECTVAVPDQEMARQHAVIEQKEAELYIRDLGSMNRILVNKREVREVRLKHGDEIELGRTRLVVQALVQAEVEGSATQQRRRYRAAWAVAATLFIGLVLALSARYVPRHEAPVSQSSPGPAVTTRDTPNTTSSTANARVSDDLRGLRDDILAIQQTVKSLVAQPPDPSPAPPPAPAVARDEVAALFEAAQAAHAGGKLPEADALLTRIQQLNADYLPAYEERAAVLEKMGRRGDSAAQWSEVLRRSIESPLYQKAVAERIRLSEAAAPEPAPDTPVLNIGPVQQTRFQASDDYEEMRILNVSLQPIQPGLRLDREAIQLEVTFYDRDPADGTVEPTEARVSQETAPAAAWGRAAGHVVASTYLVPPGLRQQQLAAGRPRAFHGYRVRVFYRGRLQDELASPKSLAGLPPVETVALP
jgi:pSer/pThr/pTyr-binding forkhead associated (FHA) protein